jgi:hypothetical protein
VSQLAEQPPKLLLDENLAARIVGVIADLYPGRSMSPTLACSAPPIR